MFPSSDPTVTVPVGMTGFDSVSMVCWPPPSGMATVPDTHMLQTISANNGILAKARAIAGSVKLPTLVPAMA